MTNITVQNANAYFRGHTLGSSWNEYSGEQKDMAIQQARRDLSRALGRALDDEEPPYVEGDTKRDEYAVYEQAVYSLIRSVQPNGGGSSVPSLEPDEAKPKIHQLSIGGGKWSMEALSWLADKLTVVTRLA